MAGRSWFCLDGCRQWHPYGQECPKAGVEGPTSDVGSSAPAVMGKIREGQIRPDEDNFSKEMLVSARVMEEAGILTNSDKQYFKTQFEKYGGHKPSHISKETAIPFVIPREFRRKKYFSGGIA